MSSEIIRQNKRIEATKYTKTDDISYLQYQWGVGIPARVGGPHVNGTWIDERVVALWYPAYDTGSLDNYVFTKLDLLIDVGLGGLQENVEICLLPDTLPSSGSYLSASGSETLYNAIKSLSYTMLSGAASPDYNTDIRISIDKDTAKLILQHGLGLKKTSSSLGGVDGVAVDMEYTNPNTPATIANTYPINRTIIANDDVTFTWSFSQEASEPQSHYDLQMSSDNGISWAAIADKVASASPECTITGGTLASGQYKWRVRAYTRSGTIVSEWAQSSVTVYNNASTTGVACDGKPMPTVTWTSAEQQAYQVKIGTYDSGVVYSAVGQHKPARYFADNAYAVTVRTQSALGVWSAWTAPLYVDIVNVPGADIALTTLELDYGVGLSWTGTQTTFYVLRDDVAIAKTTTKTFFDRLAYGDHIYKILAAEANGNYTLSNIAEQSVTLKYDIISAVDGTEWLPLKYALNAKVSRDYSDDDPFTYQYFAGREYPVGFRANKKSGGAKLRYSFKNKSEADAISALLGQDVVYKDRRGNRTIGIFDSAPRTVGKYIELSISITQTDYNEAVEYDTE